MRLFTAINFNSKTRNRLIGLQNELRSHSKRGRFTLPENLHLTLAFIGDVSPKKIEKIKAILETVSFEPFNLNINRLGKFARGTLWYAGVEECEQLMLLQREITYKLAICGFEMDGRKYNPHITLGREVTADVSPWSIEPFGETASTAELMKSERIGGELTYTMIYQIEAGGSNL